MFGLMNRIFSQRNFCIGLTQANHRPALSAGRFYLQGKLTIGSACIFHWNYYFSGFNNNGFILYTEMNASGFLE